MSEAKKKKSSTRVNCPIIGSVENVNIGYDLMNDDLTRDCDGWCPECDKAFACGRMWDFWKPEDLLDEIRRLELEEVIEDSLSSDMLDAREDDKDKMEIYCEVFADTDGLPLEMQHFLRELQKLVRRTQKKLQQLNKKLEE